MAGKYLGKGSGNQIIWTYHIILSTQCGMIF